MTTAQVTIGELARRAGVTRKSVLVYEREGLLAPARRTPAGYRLYGPNDLLALAAIREARLAGFGLADIRAVIAACRERGCVDARATAGALRQAALDRLDAEIARLRAQRGRLASAEIGANCLPTAPGTTARCCPKCGQLSA